MSSVTRRLGDRAAACRIRSAFKRVSRTAGPGPDVSDAGLAGAARDQRGVLTGLEMDEYLVRSDSSGARILLRDALGSVLALTDSTGVVQTQYTYEPFGATTVSGASNANSFQYTSRENDGTGLYYYRSRFYSPALGRFIAEDSIGFWGGSANLYAYVHNEPLLLTDPTGHIVGVMLAGGLIGGVGGALGVVATSNGNIDPGTVAAAFGAGFVAGALAPVFSSTLLAGSLAAAANGVTQLASGTSFSDLNLTSMATAFAGGALAAGASNMLQGVGTTKPLADVLAAQTFIPFGVLGDLFAHGLPLSPSDLGRALGPGSSTDVPCISCRARGGRALPTGLGGRK
jgi:RHS repeat-associated protein